MDYHKKLYSKCAEDETVQFESKFNIQIFSFLKLEKILKTPMKRLRTISSLFRNQSIVLRPTPNQAPKRCL